MKNESQILNVPIEDIIPNRFQPRLTFDEAGLKELAASIKEHGIIQPLVLRKLGDKYEIIAGERRYKASKLAGLTSVPAIISALDDRKSAEVAIVENIQRRDLTSIEEAKSYKALLDKGYLTQEELAKKMGLSQSAISNKLRLLTLSDEVQDALMNGKISERHARSLLQLTDMPEQNKWLEKTIDERLTVRELDKRIKQEKENSQIKIEEDIPIVEFAPNLEEIRNRAEDIISPTQETFTTNEVAPISTEPKEIPNKFFNYLEDETVNMSTNEPVLQVKVESPLEEEIEMLDFLAPTEDINVTIEEENASNTEEKNTDIGFANGLVEKLINDLKNSNYNVLLEKDNLTNEMKFIITIEK